MRPPDEVITVGDRAAYICRWVLWRPFGWQIVLHKTMRSDDDRALHDHPAWNLSIILWGGYNEHRPGGQWRYHGPGSFIFRSVRTQHRLELPVINGGVTYTWSLWIRGPKKLPWGFQTKEYGWLPWDIYHWIYGER